MLKVELVSYEDLTEDEQQNQPNNGQGREYANYIKMTEDDEVIMILSDAVEPEDTTFTRDFSGVLGAIKRAYEIGKVDGHWVDR